MLGTRTGWLALSTLLAAGAAPGAQIRITSLHVAPVAVKRGAAFVLYVAADSEGAEVKSYRVRTPYRVSQEQLPTGFRLEGGFAVLGTGALRDGGPEDDDPASGQIAVRIATDGFPDGTSYLVVFAHNRPGEGDHLLDYRNLALDVAGERVSIRVLPGTGDRLGEPVTFGLPSPALAPGQPVRCEISLKPGFRDPLAARLRPPYTWGENEVLPGFTYDREAKVAYYQDGPDHLLRDGGLHDQESSEGKLRLELPTTGWPPGVHGLTLELARATAERAPYGGTTSVFRDFQVKVPDPRDQLVVEVEPSWELGPGTHFGSLVALPDGSVVTEGRRSTDGGRTWQPTAGGLPRANLLAEGTLAALSYRCQPLPDRPGWYGGQLWRSVDGGRTVTGPTGTEVHVPLARPALGHGQHVGPLFGRSLVELPDGSWLAPMYGWFVGDTEPDRYRAGGTMRRAYVGRSTDRGLTWEYLSTVAYRPFLGNEGYSELVLRRLPNSEILAIVRTGGNGNPGWQDNPLMVSRSTDDGRTWSTVERTGVEGVWPDLLVLQDGTLACSTGRPGAFIMFSTDNGHTWADVTPIDGERYSGYTAICEVAPGEILMGYGVKAGFAPETGERRDMLRLTRLTVRRK